MKIKVGLFVFVTDETRMFLPVSTNDSFKIGNLNCGGLSNVLNHELMVWTDVEKSDILSLVSDIPSDIKYVALGEILVSPMCSPTRYYYIIIMKNEKSGKEYLEIQPCRQTIPKIKVTHQKISNPSEHIKQCRRKVNIIHQPEKIVSNSLMTTFKLSLKKLDAWRTYSDKIIKHQRKN